VTTIASRSSRCRVTSLSRTAPRATPHSTPTRAKPSSNGDVNVKRASSFVDMDDAATLIFDGDCGSCASSARWIEERWPDGTASAVASQDLDPVRLAEFGLSRSDVTATVWWADSHGAVSGERAVAGALGTIGGAWGLLGRVITSAPMRRPAKTAYSFAARHRHRRPGASPTCRT